MTKVTALSLLTASHSQMQLSPKNLALAKFVLELSLFSGNILSRYGTCTTVAGAVRLAEAIGRSGSKGSREESLSLGDVQLCYKELCLLLRVENRYKLSAVRRKFSGEQYLCVGKIRL